MDYQSHENSHNRDSSITSGSWINFKTPRPLLILRLLVFLWCGLYAGIFVYHGIQLVLFPFDVDNSEAYLVYQGQRLSEGQFLYPPLSEFPYLVDNYPPLYPSLLALGFQFTSPDFHWPRLISLISTLLTALFISLWCYTRTRHVSASLLAGLIYLSIYHVNDWGALARVDALGVFLSLAGLYLFERTKSWKYALLFFVLSMSTRQTLFAAPMAVFLVSWFDSPRKALWFMGSLFVLGIAIFITIMVLSSGRAWNHLIVYNANQFRLFDVWIYIRQWLTLYTVWGCIPIVILVSEHPWQSNTENAQNHTSLLFWYTIFAFGEALLCGKIGSAPNYWLSFVAAASVGIGIVYYSTLSNYVSSNNTQKNTIDKIPLFFLLAAFLFQLASTWHFPHSSVSFSYTPTSKDKLAGLMLMNDLRREQGPILSDRAGVPLLAGHPPVYQPFICTQLSKQGLWDQTGILSRIQQKEFRKIILQFDVNQAFDRERFTPEFIQAVRQNYEHVHNNGVYVIYQPKE
jgi:hypothetical protein